MNQQETFLLKHIACMKENNIDNIHNHSRKNNMIPKCKKIEESCVAVSPTQPETNEKVWIQKGKNLIKIPFTESNKKTITATSNDFIEETNYSVYLEGGKQYTISFKTDGEVGGSISENTVELFLLKEKKSTLGYYQIDTNPKTITIGASGNYYVRFDVNKNGATRSFWDIQIEQGTTATEYEAYVEPKIWCKNDNGVFEEFYNEKDKIKTQVYEASFLLVSTSTNVSFNEMFPSLNYEDVICFNTEIINVEATWDRTYANILKDNKRNGTLQIRSYSVTQPVAVRVTAFYK